MSRSAVCGRCKNLVEIVDRRWSAHCIRSGERCPVAGAIYHPAVIHGRSAGGGPPNFEVLATASRPVKCGECGKPGIALATLVKMDTREARLN
jgi:hypothetical protein